MAAVLDEGVAAPDGLDLLERGGGNSRVDAQSGRRGESGRALPTLKAPGKQRLIGTATPLLGMALSAPARHSGVGRLSPHRQRQPSR